MLPMQTVAAVVKRDGTITQFDESKIATAVSKVFHAHLECEPASEVSLKILTFVRKLHFSNDSTQPVAVEKIQDAVEEALSQHAGFGVSRAYILYRNVKAGRRQSCGGYDLDKIPDDVDTPWGPLGYVTFKRTYARALNDDSGDTGRPTQSCNTESFRQTILRVLQAAQQQLKVGFTVDELKEAYRYMKSLKGLVSGRFLWQLGTTTVERFGLMSLQNCAFCCIDDPVKPFTWVFDVLMLGTGVGVSVERKHVQKLPPVKHGRHGDLVTVKRKKDDKGQDAKDADFIVPDSREGWVSLLEKVLTAFFYTGRSFTYSTVLVRPAGSPIKGFGGTASGPEDLCQGIANIVNILQQRQGMQLTSVNCLDIIDLIGSIVVAGNIRRSALMVIGDQDDDDFIYAKRWDKGGIPNWRALSNNTVASDDVNDVSDEFWKGYQPNVGEPYGLLNPALSKGTGRLRDGAKYPDPDACGTNPCGEQSLANYETCCLAEIFLPNITSYEELQAVARMLYRMCKHSLALPCHHPQTEEIVHKHMRIGLGVTGYLQATEQQREWLPDLYEYLREFDVEYSAKHFFESNSLYSSSSSTDSFGLPYAPRAFPPSIKLTTAKPSGTLSLLAGVTSGIHPAIFQYFIRRIRINTDNPLVQLCRRNGYTVELQIAFDGTQDAKTSVVCFPCKYPAGTVLAEDVSATQQLEIVRRVQDEWSDNSVSATVYYRIEELPDMKQWLQDNFSTRMKSISFLLHSEHGFVQAPYERISAAEYEKMVKCVKPITEGLISQEDDNSNECAGGFCPLK